jgi:transcriptional regulator with XRE-family HTH domain
MFERTPTEPAMSSTKRSPGDPIPRELIRELREKHGLSQSGMAERLGVKGGKTVISGWENGHATCEGPAAELLLLLFGGRSSEIAVARLESMLDKVWSRTKVGETEWRQIVFSPAGAPRIEMQDFVRLFPEMALETGARHGFPIQARGLPQGVVSLTPHAWQGCIPIDREHRPRDVWLFTDESQFCCREVRRETRDTDSNPLGLIDLGRQIQRAVQTTHFVRNVASRLKLDASLHCTLRMDLEGVSGRTIVDLSGDVEFQLLSEPARWMENHARASLELPLGEITGDPTGTALKLVSEFAGQVSVTLANTSALRRIIARPDFRDLLSFAVKADAERATASAKKGAR